MPPVSDELACANMQTSGVGLRFASLADQRAEKPIADQFPHTDFVADVVQESVRRTDRTGLEPEWCGGETDDPQLGIDYFGVNQKLPIHPIAFQRNEMGLVHHHQIECIQFAGPLINGLDSRHDHRMLGVPSLESGRVDAEAHLGTNDAQLVGGLLEQFLDVRQDQHAAIPLADRILADAGHDRRLAASRGHDSARIVIARSQVPIHGGFDVFLIRTKCDHLFRSLSDLDDGFAAFHRLPLLNGQPNNLAVVAISAAVLECIEQRFLHVIDVPAPAVGWMNQHIHHQRTAERTNPSQRLQYSH